MSCLPRLPRLPRAERGGAKRGESNLQPHIVIASEAKQSPSRQGDGFVAALLAMTAAVTLRAKRGESAPCRLRSAVYGPLSGIVSPPEPAASGCLYWNLSHQT